MRVITISTPVIWNISEYPGGKISGHCPRLGLKAYGSDHASFVADAQYEMDKFLRQLYHEGTVHSYCLAHNLTYNIVDLTKELLLIPGAVVVPDEPVR